MPDSPFARPSSMGYVFRRLTPADPYSPAWDDLRRRVRKERVAWVLAMPFAVLAGLWWTDWRAVPWWGWLPALLGWAVSQGLSWHRERWPCPRCGRPFYQRTWGFWLFATHCVHCGLPEYAPDADAGREEAPLPSCSSKTSP
jgi:hypothetical protein